MKPVTSVHFQLVGPHHLDQVMPAWAPRFPRFDRVVGYTDLGHAFLMSIRTGEYGVLDPYFPGTKDYGVFSDISAFVDRVLFDPDFITYILQPRHVAAIRRRLGPLNDGEVYIATPYPFTGGSEHPDSYHTGGVWAFYDLVAQAHGFDSE